MKKLLSLVLLFLIGCSEQDRYEMYSPSIRIDKRNGEYEYKVCGKWYVSNWIESENLKKEYSYIPKINGLRKVNNDSRKIIKIYYEYNDSITLQSGTTLILSEKSDYVLLCPKEIKELDLGIHENFNVTKVEILKN